MANYRRNNKVPYNVLASNIEETRVLTTKEEQEITAEGIDRLVDYTLQQLKTVDPKFNFSVRNLSSVDCDNRSIRQYHYFLIWKELSKADVCKLVNDDGYFSSIELIKDPKTWSRYDLDAHAVQIGRRKFLNGLSLRDDIIKNLIEVLKSDDFRRQNRDIHFKDVEFDHANIRLIFHGNLKQSNLFSQSNTNMSSTTSLGNLTESNVDESSIASNAFHVTYVITLNPIISFTNANPILLDRMKNNLCHHEFFRNYFDKVFEPRFYLLCFNSFKWEYDVVYFEHLLFEHLSEQKSLFSNTYKKVMVLRKSWRKYFQKALKVVETVKSNDKRKAAPPKNAYESYRTTHQDIDTKSDLNLQLQFEIAIERTFTEYMFRVLFLRQCSKNKTMSENREAFNSTLISGMFDELVNSFDNKYCESFSFKYKNILPPYCMQLENCLNVGVSKVIKELYLDWKRGRFGH